MGTHREEAFFKGGVLTGLGGGFALGAGVAMMIAAMNWIAHWSSMTAPAVGDVAILCVLAGFR